VKLLLETEVMITAVVARGACGDPDDDLVWRPLAGETTAIVSETRTF
jgi:hypothetical protein